MQHAYTIIIPTRNPQHCTHLVAQLRAYGHQHIIVVHPAGTPPLHDVDCIATPTPMSAAQARNMGARHASTPLLCFLDDDISLRSDVPTYLVWCMQNPYIVAAGAVIHDASTNTYWQRCMHRIMTDSQHYSHVRHTPSLLMSMALVVRAAVFWQIGGFDETFGGAAGEDAALSLALRDHGALYVLGQAKLWHQPAQSAFGAAWARLSRYGRAWMQVLHRHPNHPSLLRGLPTWSWSLIIIATPTLALYDSLRWRPWRRARSTIFGCWVLRMAWYYGVAQALKGRQS